MANEDNQTPRRQFKILMFVACLLFGLMLAGKLLGQATGAEGAEGCGAPIQPAEQAESAQALTKIAAATLDGACLSPSMLDYFNRHWPRVLSRRQKRTTRDFSRRQSTAAYVLAATTDSMLGAARRCKDRDYLENILALYELALPALSLETHYYVKFLPHSSLRHHARRTLPRPARMWTTDANDRVVSSGASIKIPVETLLGSAKLTYAIASAANIIAGIKPSERTANMQRFVASFWNVVVEDHYERWIITGVGEFIPLRGPGNGRTGPRCQSEPERYNLSEYVERLRDRRFGGVPGYEKLTYCNALRDSDLIILNGVIEVLAAHHTDPASFPINPNIEGRLQAFVESAVALLEERTKPTKLASPDGTPATGMLVDQGVSDDHPDYCFAQDKRAGVPPAPADPCRDPNRPWNIGWEVNHSKSLLRLMTSMARHRASVAALEKSHTWFAQPRLKELANQLAYAVYNGDKKWPLFSNYMDGSNGWYRVAPSKKTMGYCPGCRSDSYYNGGWAMLADFNPELVDLNVRMMELLDIAYIADRSRFSPGSVDAVRDFMRRSYGVVFYRPAPVDGGAPPPLRAPKPYGIGAVPLTPSDPVPHEAVLRAIAGFARH